MSKNQESTKPYQSKLIPYQKEILKMWFSDKRLKDISRYLETKDIKISLQGISSFIKRKSSRPKSRQIPEHLKYILEDDKPSKRTPSQKITTPDEWRKKQAAKKSKEKIWH